MKFFFDLIPVILFFIGFKLYGIFTATAIAIGATIALIIYAKIRHGKVEKMLLVNGVIISVLGGVTLLLHDKTYIMWKPTVLYWLLAAVLLIANAFFKKNFIQQMMGKMLNAPKPVWDKLNLAWVVFLVILGFVNLYVAFNYSENAWVNFKLFGVTSIMFLFIIGQTLLLKQYLIEPVDEKESK
ncbi:MAG: septation protein A [Methylotenera sp.]|nr:MAG: septation protein A [Proteobacteria bacterium ST_bin12]PPD17689.1 MAG: septation protein A [Methylotenera sp.]